MTPFSLAVTLLSSTPTSNATSFLFSHKSVLVSCLISRLSQELHPALFQVGKLPSHSLAVTNITGLQPSHLFYITDTSTGLRFLVHTGAQVNVIPPSPADCKHPQSPVSLYRLSMTLLYALMAHAHLRSTLICAALFTGCSSLWRQPPPSQ